MKRRGSLLFQDSVEGTVVSASGMTDLMTSLAVMFFLLLAAHVANVADGHSAASPPPQVPPALIQRLASEGLAIAATEGDPHVLSIVVPDTVLSFEFGKSTLLPTAEAFVTEMMPLYASVLCGPFGAEVESFVIEGHTDDWGDDIRNMKLSQERSFAVLAKGLTVIREQLPWAYECFLKKASANGRGRQDLLFDATGMPDREKSRRVLFKLYLRRA